MAVLRRAGDTLTLAVPFPELDELLASMGAPGGRRVAARYEYMDLVAGGPAEGLTREEARSVVEAFGVQTSMLWLD